MMIYFTWARASSVALLRRQIISDPATVASSSNPNALAPRRLLVIACLGFGSFVATMLTTIPDWAGFPRYAWLTVCLVMFAGSLASLLTALAAFTPRNGVDRDRLPVDFLYEYFPRI